MAVAIAIETPLQDDVRALIAELNAALLALTPPEFCSHLTVEQMAEPDTTLFVARDDGGAVGLRRAAPASTAASARSSACTRCRRIAAARSAP